MLQAMEIDELSASLSEPEWKELYLEHARRHRTDVVPFPADEIQQLTNRLKGEETARNAMSILDCMMACVVDVAPLNKEMRVLDFGCGWGRMTRLLPIYFKTDSITGADVDERLIASAKELVPSINHVKIESMQALPFADASFDLVFANSVFSHLSERACLFALGELSRVLAKGGVMVISVLEEREMNAFYSNKEQTAWITKILGKQKKSAVQLSKKGFVWGRTGRWPEYGIAIMSDPWIQKVFDQFDVEYRNSKRTEARSSHNYKVGVKR